MADRVLRHLDEDALARLEGVLDALGLVVETGGVPVDLAGVQDGVAPAADVDERRLHRRQHVLHPAEVDVARHRARLLLTRDIVLGEHPVLEDADLSAPLLLAHDHDALDALAACEELGLGDDGAAASRLTALAAALLLRLEAHRALDGRDLVLRATRLAHLRHGVRVVAVRALTRAAATATARALARPRVVLGVVVLRAVVLRGVAVALGAVALRRVVVLRVATLGTGVAVVGVVVLSLRTVAGVVTLVAATATAAASAPTRGLLVVVLIVLVVRVVVVVGVGRLLRARIVRVLARAVSGVVGRRVAIFVVLRVITATAAAARTRGARLLVGLVVATCAARGCLVTRRLVIGAARAAGHARHRVGGLEHEAERGAGGRALARVAIGDVLVTVDGLDLVARVSVLRGLGLRRCEGAAGRERAGEGEFKIFGGHGALLLRRHDVCHRKTTWALHAPRRGSFVSPAIVRVRRTEVVFYVARRLALRAAPDVTPQSFSVGGFA